MRLVAVGDVEVYLSERAPGWQERVVVEEAAEGFIIKRKRYLSHEEFYDIHQAVKEMGGRYRSEERDWIIPRAEVKAPDSGEEVSEKPVFDVVPLSALRFPYERIRLDEGELDELVESIKSVGLLQPILVRPKGEFLEVVAGERRAKAAERAGLTEVPIIIKELSDEEADIARLIENIQRRDLSDYEKALWLRRMQEKYGYSTRKLADLLGKSHVWVIHHLNMLKVEEVVTMVTTQSSALSSVKPREIMDKLSERQARAILSAPEKYQPLLAEHVAYAIQSGVEPPSSLELEEMWREWERAEERTRLIEEIPELPERAAEEAKSVDEVMREAAEMAVPEEEVAKTVAEIETRPSPENAALLKMAEVYGYRLLDLMAEVYGSLADLGSTSMRKLAKRFIGLLLDFLEERGLLYDFKQWARHQ